MTQKNDGSPAYPGETIVKAGMHGTKRLNNSGMSLRDYFAGQALAGLNLEDGDYYVVLRAYQIADAMIKARGE